MILKTLLTLALIHPDRWHELALWELEQQGQIIWQTKVDDINIYHKGNEIIWVMNIEKKDSIAQKLHWDKLLIFNKDSNSELEYTAKIIKIIKE
jgi:hypothetical protein